MVFKKILILGQFFLLMQALTSAVFADSDIAVIRDRNDPAIEKIYFGFISVTTKRIVNYDNIPGKEVEIGKSLKAEGAKVVFIAGEARPELLAAIDPKIPIMIIGHGHPDTINVGDNANGRVIVPLEKDLTPEQTLATLAELFPGKRRVGFAYNPKLTQNVLDEFRKTTLAKDLNLVLLKVDQPNDIVNLMPSFKDKIDLFLLIMDATIIKAGAMSMAPFLRENRIPMVSSCELFTGEGPLVTMEVRPLAIGRFAADIAAKMLGGQTTFSNTFNKHDIDLTFSMKEAYKIRYTADQLQDLFDRAATAGYQVRLKP
jgi:ABC-type uncharacterized transport system substrate-binding protein